MNTFGNNILFLIHPEYREKIQHVLQNVIGCNRIQVQESSETFEFPNKILIGIDYTADALSEQDFETKAPWFEIRCKHVDGLKTELLQNKVKEVNGDPKHFFFQLPGGPVFRLADESLPYGN